MARQNLAPRDLIKALKSARTQLESPSDLSCNLHSLPERYHSAAFDAFHHHLQRSADSEQRLLGNPNALKFVFASMMGIDALGDKYFSRQGSHLQRCWPEVIKWGKTVFQDCRYHELDDAFLPVIERLFFMTSNVDLDLMKDDDTLEFAVELWKGHSTGNKADRFTTSPLLSCMAATSPKILVEYLHKHFDCEERLIVRKLLKRFSAAAKSTPKNTTVTTDLADLLRKLASSGAISILEALMCSDAITVVLDGLGAIMDDPHQTPEHGFSVQHSFDFLLSIVTTGTDHINEAIESGVLGVLVKLAANQQYGCLEKPVYLLNELQMGLVFEEIVFSAVTSMNTLTKRNFDLPQLLQLATPGFRTEWTRFESLLLEQVVIFHLFVNGYATERGSCASCLKTADRKEFKKCSGCEVVLYCSGACQEEDWPRHRIECKEVDDESMEYFSGNSDRISRRLATLQVNRYWPSIVSLAQKEDISPLHLGVHIIHDSAPYKIKVFDCRKVGESKYQFDYCPLEPMVAKEVLRRRSDSHPCLMLVISHMGTVDVSYMVYLENNLDPYAEKAYHIQGATYVDENENILYPRAHDKVEEIISRSHALSDSNWRMLWGNKPFEHLAQQATQD